jgi:S-layer protein
MNDTVLAGTSDTVTLNLIGVTNNVAVGTNTDVDGDYETLVINATGAASDLEDGDLGTTGVNTLGSDATTITVNAAVALDLGTTAGFAAVTNFNAASSAAGVTAVFANKAAAGTTAVSITGGAGADNFDISALTAANHGAVTVNTGAGNDTVVMGAAGAGDFTIVGGAGTDTVSISGDPTTTNHASVSGFETLTLSGAIAEAATNAVNMAVFTGNTGFTRVNLTQTATNANADEVITITNALDTVAVLGMAALDTDDIDINFSRLVDGTANAITVASIAATASDAVVMNDEETITFNSAEGAFDIATLSATDMTSLVLTGDSTIDLGTITAASLATVDASQMAATANGNFVAVMSSSTVAMTVTSNAATTHTGVLNITTGSGADTITGTNNADIIVSGDGADTISGGAGIDTISGGDAADTITGGLGADVISGGKGADTIILTETTAAADDVVFGNESTVTGGADIGFAALAGADTITGFGATDELVFDISAFGLAGNTEVKDAVGNLLVDSTEELVILTGVGYATDEAVETAIAGRVTTDGDEMIIVYFNTTTNTTRIIHDVDAGVDGTGTTTLIATLSDFTTLTQHETLTVDNINSFA